MAFKKTGNPQPMHIMKMGVCDVCGENEVNEVNGKRICNSCKESKVKDEE